MKVLVTGAAGFIGYHFANRLLQDGFLVYGIDNLNDYYDVNLKKARLSKLQSHARFTFQFLDLSDRSGVVQLFQNRSFDYVVNLAAQAGVRYSLQNPWAYIDANITGFVNLLEACRYQPIKHLVFASSSSVYGANTKVPFAVSDRVEKPISLYAVSKKTNELTAYAYSHLYKMPSTGLRFFTVYGPWGRPDMAYFKFVKAIKEEQAIEVYNFGKMQRDFTYINDIVEGIVRVMLSPPSTNAEAPYKLYNIGNNCPIELMRFIEAIEQALGKKAEKILLPMQPGDLSATYADVDDLISDLGFKPATSIEDGIQKFVQWYQEYYS